MDAHPHDKTDSDSSTENVTDIHNASVDRDAALQGACAQVHLPTGAMCIMRHGHDGSCEFSPAGQVDVLLAERRAADHW